MIHSGFRWLLMAAGLVLLMVAIAGITATRRGAPESGWLPSLDARADLIDGDADGDEKP